MYFLSEGGPREILDPPSVVCGLLRPVLALHWSVVTIPLVKDSLELLCKRLEIKLSSTAQFTCV